MRVTATGARRDCASRRLVREGKADVILNPGVDPAKNVFGPHGVKDAEGSVLVLRA